MSDTTAVVIDAAGPGRPNQSFLKAIPVGRRRRGVRYPQWFLLLVAVGIHEGLVWCENPELSWLPAHPIS